MARDITYNKPNMANLRGKWGVAIIEHIKNTPKPDGTNLRKEVEIAKKHFLAAQKSETQ